MILNFNARGIQSEHCGVDYVCTVIFGSRMRTEVEEENFTHIGECFFESAAAFMVAAYIVDVKELSYIII